MRIPENAISTKQKKRRKNPLQSIPGGFYVALLLFSIWGAGSLLGVWIERVYPPSELPAASIKTSDESFETDAQTEVMPEESQLALKELMSFASGAFEPVFGADELTAYVSELDLDRAYLVSACTPDSPDSDVGGVFSSLAFARAAQVAASIRDTEPQLNLQVQAESDCQLERLAISETKPKTDKQQLAMRINLALEPLSLDERLFFDEAFNWTQSSGHQLLLINHGDAETGAKLVERLVDQGFAYKQILLLKALPSDSKDTGLPDYLTAYTVLEAPKS